MTEGYASLIVRMTLSEPIIASPHPKYRLKLFPVDKACLYVTQAVSLRLGKRAQSPSPQTDSLRYRI